MQTGRVQQYMVLTVAAGRRHRRTHFLLISGSNREQESRGWNSSTSHLLTLILFVPTAAALVLLLLPKERVSLIRWVALVASLVPFVLALVVWAQFQSRPARVSSLRNSAVWYAAINPAYHLGIDGISLPMVLLTTLLTPLALLASFSINERVKPYMILFLLLETGMLGVFLSLDLLLFFVFWEIGLVPMYFLITQWGGATAIMPR